MTDQALTDQELLDRYENASTAHAEAVVRLIKRAVHLYKNPSEALDNIDHALEEDRSYGYASMIENPSRFGDFETDDPSVIDDFKAAAARLNESRKQELYASLALAWRKIPVPDDEPKFRPHTKQRGCEPTR